MSKGTKTSDIPGAVPRQLGVVFRNKIDELSQQGAFSFDNPNLIGNGDIIANRDTTPIKIKVV
jgi:hypothetical protein